MRRRERCGKCGVPLLVSSEFDWQDNGVISLKRSPHNRVALFESRIIDNLFKGIEELIGMSVEHIVIESRRREVKRYIERSFPRLDDQAPGSVERDAWARCSWSST